MGISQSELARLFKRWMLKNHPDKGGDEDVAAELNTLYTHAVGRNTLTLGLSPALALGLSPSPADVVIARPTWL